jgi:aminoglycoside phosphotransferase (APT) family kinase protein
MTDTRTERFSGTKEMDDRLALDIPRLETYLAAQIDGFAGPLSVEQFKGGQSNPTYLLTTPGAKYVLRRKPPGKLLPSAHAVDREFRVIKALGGTDVPVPRALHLCEDESIAGTIFFVMSFEEGRVLWEPLLPEMTPAQRGEIYSEMNRVIAALHSVDVDAVGLTDFGKPGNYFQRQIGRWSKQYRASEGEAIAEMDRLMDWLPENLPPEGQTDEVSVVHGDYRIDNMIFHPTEPRVLGVLDWELSTLGHPLADFSYHLMLWRMPKAGGFVGMAGTNFKSLGVPDEAEYAAMYCERTGRAPIPQQAMNYFMAYNAFRIAAILQGIAGRVRDGTATSEHAKVQAAAVTPLAKFAMGFATAAGA